VPPCRLVLASGVGLHAQRRTPWRAQRQGMQGVPEAPRATGSHPRPRQRLALRACLVLSDGRGRGHAGPQELPAAGEANGAHHGAPRPAPQRGDECGHAFHDRFPMAFECLEKWCWRVGVDGRRPQPVIQENGVLSIAVLLLANSLGLYFNAMGQGLWIGKSVAPATSKGRIQNGI
jgi:hypothetical protein